MTSSKALQTFASIGVDIGKEIFRIVGFSLDGKIVLRKKVKRLALEKEFEKLAPSIVGMEACLSAHFVSRMLRRLGHQPRIIPAFYVKPFSKIWQSIAVQFSGSRSVRQGRVMSEEATRLLFQAGSFCCFT